MKATLTNNVSEFENLTQPSLAGKKKQEDFCGGSLGIARQRSWEQRCGKGLADSADCCVVYSRTA